MPNPTPTMADVPAAKPSIPSVRFTALVTAMEMKMITGT